ncbi:response regulator transcription factor [Listeria monocytogenes]|nr:response regulator transcription factor [Listeria monocytogenes]
MNVYLLEDEKLQRARMKRIIEKVAYLNNIDINLLFDTGTPEKLMERITHEAMRGPQMLYFLDIEIKDKKTRKSDKKKGFEIAKQIRALDRFANIVFVTTHSEFATITYQYMVSALYFIAKDQEEDSLENEVKLCLEHVVNESNKKTDIPSSEVFEFETEYTKIEIPLNEILYFETLIQPHKVAVITTNQRIEFYSNLTKIENSNERFIRCHKSFVVNVCNIIDIDRINGLLILKNETTCYLARRKYKLVQEGRLLFSGK